MSNQSYKVSSNFDVREFLHPSVWKALPWPSCLWVLDERMWKYAELLRSMIGDDVYVNTWFYGGDLVGRGHRPRTFFPKGGGSLSQHYLSRAVDASSRKMTAQEMFRLILDNEQKFIDIGITTLEDISLTPTWVHADWRPFVPGLHVPGKLLIVGK